MKINLSSLIEKHKTIIRDKIYLDILNVTPVRTGRLLSGWRLTKDRIYNNTPYAGFVRYTKTIEEKGVKNLMHYLFNRKY